MLIIALVLAVIGLVALVFAVVTSSQLVAWVCIAASVVGVVLLIIDAVRERQGRAAAGGDEAPDDEDQDAVDYPEEAPDERKGAAKHPDHETSESVAADHRGDDSDT